MKKTISLLAFLVLGAIVPSPGNAGLIGITHCIPPVGRPSPHPSALKFIYEHDGSPEDISVIDFCETNSLAKSSRGFLYTVGKVNRPGVGSAFRDERVLIRIDPGVWAAEQVAAIDLGPDVERPSVRGLAFSPDDTLYAIDHQPWTGAATPDEATYLYHVDIHTGRGTRIGPTGLSGIQGIAFAPDGALYGWDIDEGLVTIDTTTGTATDVNPRIGGGLSIQTIEFTSDGRLFGARYELFAIDPDSGEFSVVGRVGWDIRGLVFQGAPLLQPPLEPYPEELHSNRLFLWDCGSCPACFGLERPCDPRISPLFDRFAVTDLKNDISMVFSRSKLGLTIDDGPLRAAAPVNPEDGLLFVASVPYADSKQRNVGAVLLFDGSGKIKFRIEGKKTDELFGMSIDVRDGEIAVVSTQRLLRIKKGKIVHEAALGANLNAQRGMRVAFTGDTDGDGRAEILLGAPYASVGTLREAGQIQVIGSKTGKVIHTYYGRVAHQHLGKALMATASHLGAPMK